MEYEARDDRELFVVPRLGMGPFRSPSVFGFYLPDYKSEGALSRAGLVSPEAQLATAPNLISFLNGMNSLIDYGLTNCFDGFGNDKAVLCGRSVSDGWLNYMPADGTDVDAVVEEMGLLLTIGRLNSFTREIIKDTYAAALDTEIKLPEGITLEKTDECSCNS